MALLEVSGLDGFYGDFQALHGIDLQLAAGETLAIIGANGAGKSTFLKSVVGLLPAPADAIRFDGRPIGGLPPSQIVKLGITLVPEGRRLFPSLTVEENLQIGAHARAQGGHWRLDSVYALFPAIAACRGQSASTLSGGQQQMTAIGRALMSNPRLLLCDELSLGLAPIVIRDIYAALPAIRAAGTSLVLVEQDIMQAMKAATRVCCFLEGRIALRGAASELTDDAIHAAYFGI
jgi:branched-chain amino acid transport system ATP-binding protein